MVGYPNLFFFSLGRMAYVVDLEEEFVDSDVPTTVVRSKMDCPMNVGTDPSSNTNDLVVNKLTQILAYLRQGLRFLNFYVSENSKRSFGHNLRSRSVLVCSIP